tara:strand:- start:1251 stop:1682 length:432 start_codon:yes stop_codon:yes gene_type:complete
MATNYTNNFKNILDRLTSIFRDEFKGSLPVYIGKEEPTGTQHLRLIPVGSSLSEYNASSELREYTINFILTFKDVNTTQKGLEQVLRLISRIESLVMDNISMELEDRSNTINCRIESTDISELPETGYSVFFVYQCQHLGNLS